MRYDEKKFGVTSAGKRANDNYRSNYDSVFAKKKRLSTGGRCDHSNIMEVIGIDEWECVRCGYKGYKCTKCRQWIREKGCWLQVSDDEKLPYHNKCFNER